MSSQQGRSQKAGRNGVYYGESSRSLHERIQEHIRDADNFDPGSHMVKHWMTSHAELKQRPTFRFKIIKRFRDCLSRQVAEAIKILTTKDSILNSKNEYLNNCIPRIVVDETRLERLMREQREEKNEKDELKRLENFRLEKQSQKRSSRTAEETFTRLEPREKKLKKDHSLEGYDEINLGDWLDKVERTFQRVGDLRRRMEMERLEVTRKMDEKKHDEILKDVGDWVRRMCPEDKEILKPQDKMQGSSVAGPSLHGRVGFLTNTKNPSLTRIVSKREK